MQARGAEPALRRGGTCSALGARPGPTRDSPRAASRYLADGRCVTARSDAAGSDYVHSDNLRLTVSRRYNQTHRSAAGSTLPAPRDAVSHDDSLTPLLRLSVRSDYTCRHGVSRLNMLSFSPQRQPRMSETTRGRACWRPRCPFTQRHQCLATGGQRLRAPVDWRVHSGGGSARVAARSRAAGPGGAPSLRARRRPARRPAATSANAAGPALAGGAAPVAVAVAVAARRAAPFALRRAAAWRSRRARRLLERVGDRVLRQVQVLAKVPAQAREMVSGERGQAATTSARRDGRVRGAAQGRRAAAHSMPSSVRNQ